MAHTRRTEAQRPPGFWSPVFVPFRSARPRRWRGAFHVLVALAALAGTACVSLVPAYEQSSVDRTTEISEAVLAFYQDLLVLSPDERKAAVAGDMTKRAGGIETQIRVHLLREQGRSKNGEAITIAENLLKSWQEFSRNHREGDATALTDATLNIERGILERHLRSAFVAEEARKLVSSK